MNWPAGPLLIQHHVVCNVTSVCWVQNFSQSLFNELRYKVQYTKKKDYGSF